MKRFKITSVILSVTMLFSMLMPSVTVMADEASAPSETQTTESEDKKEPEETKKQETKESETVKETEAPKETAAPKETEAVKETEVPEETEPAKESAESEPSKETEKAEPEETEPSVSETEAPKETEKNEPDTTETPDVPEETSPVEPEVPGEPDASVSVKPKMAVGTINNPVYADGVLSWDKYNGAEDYRIDFTNYPDAGLDATERYCDLEAHIEESIQYGSLERRNSYTITISALKDNQVLATCNYTFAYTHTESPVQSGKINANITSSGMLHWTAYPGTDHYKLYVNNCDVADPWRTAFCLTDAIDYNIKVGSIQKSSSYSIYLEARDANENTIASWSKSFSYISSATYIQLGDINTTLNNGILTWSSYSGTSYYDVSVGDDAGSRQSGKLYSNTFNLDDFIKTQIEKGAISIQQSYYIVVRAFDNDDFLIANWVTDYSYVYVNERFGSATVTGIVDMSYTGTYVTQNLTVKLDGRVLKEDTDYTVSYTDNLNVGTAKITITGKGSYKGEIKKQFNIKAADISNAKTSNFINKSYTGEELTQTVLVALNGKLLSNTDYTVSYSDNINAGTAKATITGIGNYTGTIEKTFTILASKITNATVKGIEDVDYSGSAVTPSPTLTLNNKALAEGTDYDVSYADNINAGNATVRITGKGNYEGIIVKSFRIKTVDISNVQITGIADMPYTGSEIEITPVLTLNGNNLAEGTDYTLSYENNTEIGTATIKITGIGNFTGSFSTTFNIVKVLNPMTVKSGQTAKLKYKKLRKKKQTVSLPKVIKLANAKGSVTYKLNSAKKSKKSFKKYFKINAATGVITVKKKLKKGTYTLSCSATAAGNQNYQKVTKGVTIKIKVK